MTPILNVSIIMRNDLGITVVSLGTTVALHALPNEAWMKTEVQPLAAQFVAEATKDLSRVLQDGLDLAPALKNAHTPDLHD